MIGGDLATEEIPLLPHGPPVYQDDTSGTLFYAGFGIDSSSSNGSHQKYQVGDVVLVNMHVEEVEKEVGKSSSSSSSDLGFFYDVGQILAVFEEPRQAAEVERRYMLEVRWFFHPHDVRLLRTKK